MQACRLKPIVDEQGRSFSLSVATRPIIAQCAMVHLVVAANGKCSALAATITNHGVVGFNGGSSAEESDFTHVSNP